MPERLFVSNERKRGFYHHCDLKDLGAIYLGPSILANAQLYISQNKPDSGRGFGSMTEGTVDVVEEVFGFQSAEVLEELDYVFSGTRKMVILQDGTAAWTYFCDSQEFGPNIKKIGDEYTPEHSNYPVEPIDAIAGF